MFDKLTAVEQRYDELVNLLGTAQVQSDPPEFKKHAKAAYLSKHRIYGGE